MRLPVNDNNRKWWVLGTLGGVLGLVLLDETIIGVALPTMRDDLHLSASTSHWIVNAYLLALTCFVAAAGKIGDVIDSKRLFMLGLFVFALASLAAGFAQNAAWMLTARTLQGIGAAMALPTSVAMITTVFPPEQRGLAFGIFSATGTVFLALGPLIGGVFTETLSWRWIFWVNLPLVAAVVLIISVIWVHTLHEGERRSFDFLGFALLVLGLSSIVLVIMEGPEWGWREPVTISLAAAGVVLMALFIVIELRLHEPLIDIALFRNAIFTAGNLVFYTAQFNKIPIVIFMALYLEDVLKMNPLKAGLSLLVAVAPIPFAAVVGGRLVDRVGARWVILLSLCLAGAALLWIGLVIPEQRYALLVAPMVLWGISMPSQYAAPRQAVLNALPKAQHGQATGINLTAQLLGGTIGMAVGSTLLTVTGDYRPFLIVTAGLNFAVFAIALLLLSRPRPSATSGSG